MESRRHRVRSAAGAARRGLLGGRRHPRHVLEGRRTDLPGQVPVVPRAGLDCADVADHLSRTRARGRKSIKRACRARQMPPWHIDRSVGVQKFKNDMSLTDEQVDDRSSTGSIRAPPRAIPPTCRRRSRSRPALYWQAERDGYGPPDIVVSRADADHAGGSSGRVVASAQSTFRSTEPRWVKMVEIRPSNLQGRKILHHSIAYQVLNPENADGRQHRHRRRRAVPAPHANRAATCVNRRPQLMEWAIGKGYDRYHGRHRQADHAGREDFVGSAHPRRRRGDHQRVGARHLALSERAGAEEAQLPDWLHRPQERPARRSTSRRTRLPTPKGSRCCARTRVITNFQPHFHLRGKAMQVEAILPDGRTQIISYVVGLQLQLDDELHLRRRRGAGVPEGHDHPRHRVVRQHQGATRAIRIPNQWVGYGDRTVDEMAHAWMNVVYLTDAEYQEWLAEHKPAQPARNSSSSSKETSMTSHNTVASPLRRLSALAAGRRDRSRRRTAAAEHAAEGVRRERHAGLRRLVQQRRRHAHAS